MVASASADISNPPKRVRGVFIFEEMAGPDIFQEGFSREELAVAEFLAKDHILGGLFPGAVLAAV